VTEPPTFFKLPGLIFLTWKNPKSLMGIKPPAMTGKWFFFFLHVRSFLLMMTCIIFVLKTIKKLKLT
jgi:hypothetical protein